MKTFHRADADEANQVPGSSSGPPGVPVASRLNIQDMAMHLGSVMLLFLLQEIV